MKRKAVRFDPEALVRSAEAVRDALAGGQKHTLRTNAIALLRPAPRLTGKDIARLRRRLDVSQPVFAALLNVPTDTAISWEKGRRTPSGAARRLLLLLRKHPDVLRAA